MKESEEEVRPGKYRHYKGGEYTVLFVAAHHETRAPQVVYICHETGEPNTRPVRGTRDDPDGWLDEVNMNKGLVHGDGKPLAPLWRTRFTYIDRVDEPVTAG